MDEPPDLPPGVGALPQQSPPTSGSTRAIFAPGLNQSTPDSPPVRELRIRYPAWVSEIDWGRRYQTDREKMDLAIQVARMNVDARTGGPFGSAIFDRDTGELIAVGMNLVVPSRNSTLHGEMVAFQMAEARLGTHDLGGDAKRRLELFTSCEPCAMCIGATLWSGVSRMVTAATGDDARALGFDEGPVFEESYRYLEKKGIEISRSVSREQAREVFDLYQRVGGPIYNSHNRDDDESST